MERQNKQREYRTVTFEKEIRSEEGGGQKMVLRGYPILFNNPTRINDWWYGEIEETILPTALDGTRLDSVYLLRNHDADKVLGRVGVNMRVEVDETGLFFECELPDTQLARDTYNDVASGIIDGMSFGFRCSDQVNESTLTRTITHIDELYEITITPFPAYEEASVVAKREADFAAEKKRAAQEAAEKQRLAEEHKKFIKEMEEW